MSELVPHVPVQSTLEEHVVSGMSEHAEDVAADMDVEQECAEPQSYSRPRRNCWPPERYGNCISYQQQVSTDWTLRVQYLTSLISLYPHFEEQLLHCIMQVVTKF